jgi:hypothetical protein
MAYEDLMEKDLVDQLMIEPLATVLAEQHSCTLGCEHNQANAFVDHLEEVTNNHEHHDDHEHIHGCGHVPHAQLKEQIDTHEHTNECGHVPYVTATASIDITLLHTKSYGLIEAQKVEERINKTTSYQDVQNLRQHDVAEFELAAKKVAIMPIDINERSSRSITIRTPENLTTRLAEKSSKVMKYDKAQITEDTLEALAPFINTEVLPAVQKRTPNISVDTTPSTPDPVPLSKNIKIASSSDARSRLMEPTENDIETVLQELPVSKTPINRLEDVVTSASAPEAAATLTEIAPLYIVDTELSRLDIQPDAIASGLSPEDNLPVMTKTTPILHELTTSLEGSDTGSLPTSEPLPEAKLRLSDAFSIDQRLKLLPNLQEEDLVATRTMYERLNEQTRAGRFREFTNYVLQPFAVLDGNIIPSLVGHLALFFTVKTGTLNTL